MARQHLLIDSELPVPRIVIQIIAFGDHGAPVGVSPMGARPSTAGKYRRAHLQSLPDLLWSAKLVMANENASRVDTAKMTRPCTCIPSQLSTMEKKSHL